MVNAVGYREDMRQCRDYISRHCGEDISAQSLAEHFGYSFFHFCHVFRSCNGMAVVEYLRDVRLARAAAEIAEGGSITRVLKDGIEIACGDHNTIIIRELQGEGGRRMPAADYLRGHPIHI